MEKESDMSSNVKFNAGYFQIVRIHEVQRLINLAKINPTSYNKEYNLWNYQLWFNCLNTLLDEIWSKLYPEEKKQANKDRTSMIATMSTYNVIKSKHLADYSDKKVSVIDAEKWKKLLLLLIEYDNYVKDLMDAHGWNNPYVEDDDPY